MLLCGVLLCLLTSLIGVIRTTMAEASMSSVLEYVIGGAVYSVLMGAAIFLLFKHDDGAPYND
tara:strand:- start:2781 stop:2969 length:189 start_codon:yes stop_codon:yes gene_type:complete